MGHFGINSCIRRARDSVYWYGMSHDITETIKKCDICERNQKNNPKEPLILRRIPIHPWQIVATEIFEYNNKMFLVIVDSYSGYIDFTRLKDINSKQVIEALKIWFATHGVPEEVWSDNGTQYTSREFKNFEGEWNFKHVISSPRYPQSNGLAERGVQAAKNILKKCTRRHGRAISIIKS